MKFSCLEFWINHQSLVGFEGIIVIFIRVSWGQVLVSDHYLTYTTPWVCSGKNFDRQSSKEIIRTNQSPHEHKVLCGSTIKGRAFLTCLDYSLSSLRDKVTHYIYPNQALKPNPIWIRKVTRIPFRRLIQIQSLFAK